MAEQPHEVIVVGGGFDGLDDVKYIRKAPQRVILIDRSNHHLFQPLFYQVASAVLGPGQIASPIRNILRDQSNVTVIMGEVTSVNKENRQVLVSDVDRQG